MLGSIQMIQLGIAARPKRVTASSDSLNRRAMHRRHRSRSKKLKMQVVKKQKPFAVTRGLQKS